MKSQQDSTSTRAPTGGDGVGCFCGWPLDSCNPRFANGTRCGKREFEGRKMAQRMTNFCDRCGLEIPGTVPSEIRVELKRFNTDYHGTNVDLCGPCSIQLTAWLERVNGGAPPGYKFVPRPCPHNIPCADPQGCSGQELVPV